jgi:DNA-directed RNA polymerase III subunit RPC11
MFFCPRCGNRTVVNHVNTYEDPFLFVCPVCPYKAPIRETEKSTKYSRLKEVDDVLNDANTWKNVDKTHVKCPKCEHDEAYFMQVQIRSADEPSTNFYRCVSCAHNWKEN